MTPLLVVREVRRARAFDADGRVVVGENPGVGGVADDGVIMSPGWGPPPDTPDVERGPEEASSRVSSFVNAGVADSEAIYRDWLVRGAHFPTPGVVQRRLAEQVPAGGEAGGADGR
jgi:hypothetical protein